MGCSKNNVIFFNSMLHFKINLLTTEHNVYAFMTISLAIIIVTGLLMKVREL